MVDTSLPNNTPYQLFGLHLKNENMLTEKKIQRENQTAGNQFFLRVGFFKINIQVSTNIILEFFLL